MTVLLSMVLFFVPGWTSLQAQDGSVSGIVRDASGKPQVGVRVAALAVLPDEPKSGDVLVSIGKTDESGGYSLEIPRGRYYIVAGRVNSPTYYPNVIKSDQATVLSRRFSGSNEGSHTPVLGLSPVLSHRIAPF